MLAGAKKTKNNNKDNFYGAITCTNRIKGTY